MKATDEVKLFTWQKDHTFLKPIPHCRVISRCRMIWNITLVSAFWQLTPNGHSCALFHSCIPRTKAARRVESLAFHKGGVVTLPTCLHDHYTACMVILLKLKVLSSAGPNSIMRQNMQKSMLNFRSFMLAVRHFRADHTPKISHPGFNPRWLRPGHEYASMYVCNRIFHLRIMLPPTIIHGGMLSCCASVFRMSVRLCEAIYLY